MNNNEFTVKQIAEVIGVSKQAVQKVINKNNISYDSIDKNRQIYNYETAVIIISLMRDDFDFSKLKKVVDTPQTANQKNDNLTTENENQPPTTKGDPLSSAPENENKTDNSATTTDNQQTTENQVIEILRQTIDTLQNQLIEKDKQIENLTKIIQAEQIKVVKAIPEIIEEHERKKKKGFFNKLFSKKQSP